MVLLLDGWPECDVNVCSEKGLLFYNNSAVVKLDVLLTKPGFPSHASKVFLAAI